MCLFGCAIVLWCGVLWCVLVCVVGYVEKLLVCVCYLGEQSECGGSGNVYLCVLTYMEVEGDLIVKKDSKLYFNHFCCFYESDFFSCLMFI